MEEMEKRRNREREVESDIDRGRKAEERGKKLTNVRPRRREIWAVMRD